MAVSVPDQAGEMAAAAVTDETVICANCGAEAFAGESFCENCGAQLPGAVPAASAGGGGGESSVQAATQPIAPDSPASTVCQFCAGTIADDGYCSTCGAPAVRERDHWLEQPAPWVAAVCDRGIRHHRNEDAVALSAQLTTPGRAVLVVCDGVSSSMDSDVASLAAARTARDVLGSANFGAGSSADRISDWTDRLSRAAAAANAEVVDVSRHPTRRPGERQNSPASCTFVAAVVDGPLVVAGWVGDSRAYWVPDVDSGQAEQLSVDDSWASEQMLAGMPRAEAESAPQAHAITRWLGVDSPDFEPKCTAITPAGSGWLLVCSDGLWNYCSPADELGQLVSTTAATAGGDPARMAADLVDWANAQGGMDNITVALARLDVVAVSAEPTVAMPVAVPGPAAGGGEDDDA